MGASARVVGNSFLFALRSEAGDTVANAALMSRRWMDLALIYASGKRAIITLEKGPDAEAAFADVFAAWAKGALVAKAGDTRLTTDVLLLWIELQQQEAARRPEADATGNAPKPMDLGL